MFGRVPYFANRCAASVAPLAVTDGAAPVPSPVFELSRSQARLSCTADFLLAACADTRASATMPLLHIISHFSPTASHVEF